MKFRFLMSAMLAAAVFCAAPTWAGGNVPAHRQGAVSDSPTPKSSNYDITLTITGGYGGSGVYTTTGCPGGANYADTCISGNCYCYTYSGKASGAAGSGDMTIYESYDDDIWYAGIAGDSGCDLAFGDIEISGSKDTESISLIGSDCGSDFNPQGFISGGCTLEDTDVFEYGAVGPCSGSFNDEYGKNTKFTIKGKSYK